MIFYDFILLLLALCALPKWLIQRIFTGKYRGTFTQRLKARFPAPDPKRPVIWLHMVSVGEVRAALPLYNQLKESYPRAQIYLSTITATGLEEARRSFQNPTALFLLPFDFSFIMRNLLKRLSPKVLILSEGDFWYNQLKYAKQNQAQIMLVSGKISERSTKRLSYIPFFAKALLNKLDLLCVQNADMARRFESLGVNPSSIHITGNLKNEGSLPLLTPERRQELKNHLGLTESDKVVVIGSTHPGEEELILSQLDLSKIKVLLAARHPERFETLARSLDRPFGRYSRREHSNLILIDAMGLLTSLYQLADLAIVGGSFVPGIGGHNILEPIKAHIPVLFGPYMANQTDLVAQVLNAGAGLQLEPTDLGPTVHFLLEDAAKYAALQSNAKTLSETTKKGLDEIFQILSLSTII